MIGVMILTSIGFIMSVILVCVDAKVNTKSSFVDETVKMLPGYNCGACGFGTCLGMAEAMDEDVLNYKKCKPMRGDTLREMEMFLKKSKKIDME